MQTELHKRPIFDPELFKGSRYFHDLNGDSKFPDFGEGFWRKNLFVHDELPFPIPMIVKGFNKEEFLATLRKVQESATRKAYRGFALNRWNGEMAGNGEYQKDGWKWPESYVWYIERNVPPSKEFFKFITGKDCAGLPSYGRKGKD